MLEKLFHDRAVPEPTHGNGRVATRRNRDIMVKGKYVWEYWHVFDHCWTNAHNSSLTQNELEFYELTYASTWAEPTQRTRQQDRDIWAQMASFVNADA